MTSKNLPWHGLTVQLFLKFLLITQHEVPFINTSEVTKRLSNRTEHGKCTDVTNCRSCVGLSTPIYTNHCYNYRTPDLFWWVFSLSRIFTDLITHNYRSNQSALMTRCGTDFSSSLWNFRRWITDVLHMKRHSGRERRRTAVFAGYLSRYAYSPSLSTVLKSLVERATTRTLKVHVLCTITYHDAVVREKNPDCSVQSLV